MTEANGNLSPKQTETLKIIATWREGFPRASVLAKRLGLADEASVRVRLRPLEQRGYVERESLGVGLPMVLKVTEAGLKAIGLFEPPPKVARLKPTVETSLPVVDVPCGPLGETVKEVEYVSHPFNELGPHDYLVTAEGESMWDARRMFGIPPGARVRMRDGVYPQNGEVVHVDFVHESGKHECTLKVWYQDEKTGLVTLQAINPVYSDIVLSADHVEVKGVAQELVTPALRVSKRGRK